ncbi:hypothetical protein A4H97_04010 [Niastella yeongjuensis]|uniref:Uncharacterized protein n=1 Tax=Niastella yeongjuensis TaxID=354355 RepID=A0A1V9EYF4_9BACT|nr:hypothetical protein [Niastella yeongjuensis]OQP50995.1 hypothetical protein A4H97_04010 [Niastella yeongjuensis]SEN07879.1 hypothetical protein SAMN05660816_00134 [Niastella yeongjuensis]
MKNMLLVVLIMGLGIPSVLAQTVQPMLGWKMEENKGHYFFSPTAVFSDENKEFSYEIMPLEKADGKNFDEWFTGSIDRNMRFSGFTEPKNKNKDKKNISYSTLSSYSGKITDKNGKVWYVAYMAYRTSNQQYRLAKLFSSPDITYYTNCMKSAAMHFGKLAKQEGAFETGGQNEVAKTNALPQPLVPAVTEKAPTPRNVIANADNTNRAVRGLKATEIKGIVLNLEYSYGVGGAVMSEYTPYLLLNDGSLYSNPVVSPYEFDVAVSKQREPKKWGTWRISGGAIVVSWPTRNKTERWEKNWFWGRPAAGNEKIEGAFSNMAGAGGSPMGGNVVTVSSKNILFNTVGRFALTGVSVGTNYTDYSIPTAAYSKKDEAGSYILKGYSIELRFNNGSSMRRAFYFYPKDKAHLGIGSHVYVQKR